MGTIFYLMGKSSSGKDTLYQELSRRCPDLKGVVPYTTRPVRAGEEEGAVYHFTGEERLAELEAAGKVIELRTYDTIHGIWKYFTVDDGQIDLEKGNYLMIGTLESYEKMREYYGAKNLIPLYIEVEDGERLMRAIRREKRQAKPRYRELCRRFLADEEDFSDEKLRRLHIDRRFQNTDMGTCLEEIIEVIHSDKL